jgi:hypothetical protein
MFLNPLPDVAAPGVAAAFVAMAGAVLCVLFFLIVFLEAVALQWLKWAAFRPALRASFFMNLVSTLVGFLVLAFVNSLGVVGLAISWALSVLIEGDVLMLLRRDGGRQNWRAALVANLASYLILLLPAYLLSF